MPRSKARSSIFTRAMDELLKEMYPTQGGKATLSALNERFHKTYTISQLHSRCAVLELSAGRGANDSKPRWSPDLLSDPDGFVVGCWILLEYLGCEGPDKHKKMHHHYKVRCVRCGRHHILRQESIAQSARKGSKGCAKCAYELKAQLEREYRARVNEEEAAIKREWIEFNQMMPIAPLDLVPEHKLFDAISQPDTQICVMHLKS